MRRRYNAAQFLAAVRRVRAAVPGCSVTTDIISGFPGETEADHIATLSVCHAARFAAAHVFPFSSRPGTTAAHLPAHVSHAGKVRRAAELRELTAAHADEYRRSAIGKVRHVLWERRTGVEGLTDTYLRVRRAPAGKDASPANALPGRAIEPVLLTGLEGEVLIGEPVYG
jgi:threonylcarbamoyladenosine tRNA methylthiotransferase MtaB